jgi:predicted RNA-binding protein with PIN domain
MRWLIDGYNVMHAGGYLSSNKLGREGFRRARRRFLDELADALGSDHAEETTIVFDASVPPGDFALEATYRGLHVVFALEDEDADARIERLIGQDSNPKILTVISSDRRIRQAAARRRARSLTADDFWDWIDDLRERAAGAKRPRRERPGRSTSLDRSGRTTPEEAEFWLETFRELAEAPETREALATDSSLLTDAEITEIQRQVDREA